MREIVVIGGGFAGLWATMAAARQLDEADGRRADVGITVFSRDGYLGIRPRFHEAVKRDRPARTRILWTRSVG